MSTNANSLARHDSVSPAATIGLALLVTALGGLVGLLMGLVMAWLARASWATDDAGSHGISERHSSRLGGVAVAFGAAGFFFTLQGIEGPWAPTLTSPSDFTLPDYALAVLLIGLVGLWDDLAAQLSAGIRLILVLSISCWAIVSSPEIMPASVYGWVPEAIDHPAWLIGAGALLVAGFVNAGNMADGANGLLASIALTFFVVAYWHSPTGYYGSAILALLVFLVVNVATGRIFLGDFGSYTVSSALALSGLALYATGGVSLWFLGSVLAYPCIELVRVTISRLLKSQSPLRAGDDHLHNHLFKAIRLKVKHQLVGNSLTGCVIGLLTAALPAALGMTGVLATNNAVGWLVYFLLYMVCHLVAYQQLKAINARN